MQVAHVFPRSEEAVFAVPAPAAGISEQLLPEPFPADREEPVAGVHDADAERVADAAVGLAYLERLKQLYDFFQVRI